MKTAAVYFPLLRLWKWPGMYAVVAVQHGQVSVGGWSWSPVGGCDCCVWHGCVLVGGGPWPFRITCGSGRLSSCSVSDWTSSSSNPFASSSSLIHCWGGTLSVLCNALLYSSILLFKSDLNSNSFFNAKQEAHIWIMITSIVSGAKQFCW